jgi:hypothetical protein
VSPSIRYKHMVVVMVMVLVLVLVMVKPRHLLENLMV